MGCGQSVFYPVAQPGRRVGHTLPYRRQEYLAQVLDIYLTAARNVSTWQKC